ncbi:ComEC/Rec2 family competence protein [Arthrobacter sp. FW306-05-C]|uniref:ComEC/Rec2 family competence protein n=1 Tax=Arthrobacter sp. FW306-05-C TaxID=2879620 RepID=UPI001F366097|nr:ComEC/Rec2 family competence protein [Arthrobacter sp. FW306-05-C]UKA68843.1 ComEC/Rec2 family competence protein [Arthrobacter sp. FW306-05-C]
MDAVPAARETTPTSGLDRVRARIVDARKVQEEADSSPGQLQKRTDLRLALPAASVWAASVAGLWLPPTELAALCCALVALGGAFLAIAARGGRKRRAHGGTGPAAVPTFRRARGRSYRAAAGVSLILAAAAAAHSATASSQRSDGPLAEAVAAGKSAVAVVEVAGSPRAIGGRGGTGERWSVPVLTREVTTSGVLVRIRARLVVMGGRGWGNVVPGQTLRATGKLRPAEPGGQEAGNLNASTGPGNPSRSSLSDNGSLLEAGARDLRGRFVAASAFLPPDARGLLPGMVTGDTSALDEGLGNAMKAVGMTHLTAVSGANCSLVLGALLVMCRRIRLPRTPAAGAALAGLALFVVLVGPDASVLRAALMGAIGVASLAGGRSGRGLSFLCLAVIGLLLSDPELGSSFGFLLSVLATLGIILLGRRILGWIPAAVPRWVAAAVAVPLSAQLLCGPVIVLLQPQFATYSLMANVAASPLVAPVTLLGTAAVPLVVLLPWVATGLIAVAGMFSAGVGGIARCAAQLPGSALPWPEGIPGLLSMVLLSVVTLATVCAAARPLQVVRKAQEAHAATVVLIGLVELRLQQFCRACGLDRGHRHGRLGYCNNTSGRDLRWPLRKSEQPAPRHRTRPPGGT